MSRLIAAAAARVARAAEALSLRVSWRRSSPAPALPGHPEPDGYDSLLGLVGLFLSVRRQRASLSGGQLLVEAGDGVLCFDLAPLAEACRGRPRSAWPDAVAAFLSDRLGGPGPEPERTWPQWLAADAGPAPAAAPLLPLAPVVAAAPEHPAALPGRRLRAWLGTAAAALLAVLARASVFLCARLRRGAVLFWGLLCRLAAFLRARLRGVAAASSALVRRAAVLSWALLRRGVASWTARLQRAAPGPEPEPAPLAEEWSEFGALVIECFRRHGFPQAKVGRDVVLARDSSGRQVRVQAPGLERVPRELARERWVRWVDGVLGERLRTLRGREALKGRSFADVRALLALQLYGEEWLSQEVLADAVYSRDLPGLISALVCRLPEGTFCLSGETVTAWRVEAQQVAEAALVNLRRLRPPMQRVLIAPGVEVMRFRGDDGFAAAQAVLLGENRECAHAYGALVALPQRSLLLVCPLRPRAGAAAAYTAAAASLIARVLEGEPEGHLPLSRRLYWYRNGAFVDLPYDVRAEGRRPLVEFVPTEALAATLAHMETAPLPAAVCSP